MNYRSVVLSLLLAAMLVLQPLASAQAIRARPFDYSEGASGWPPFANIFDAPEIPDISLSNSGRLEALLHDAKLYLSLSDALALAIENNLDIAWSRYGPRSAANDLMRAKSGAQLRGVQNQISVLSTGLGDTGGARPVGQATGITQRAGGAAAGGGGGGGGGAADIGDASTFFGTTAVNLDPSIFGNIDWGHFSNPQTSDFVTGTNTLVREISNSQIGLRQGFVSGATMALIWANSRTETNSLRNNFNPSLISAFTLRLTQPLLQGFGVAVNTRNIEVARNNHEISNLQFKLQVEEVVTRVSGIYWGLVSLRAQVESQRQNLELARKLYSDNQRRVEIGTLAPIEVIRAEAEVAAREADLTAAQTEVQLQETLLKDAISVNGIASPTLLHAEIVPTDEIAISEDDDLEPLPVLMDIALRARADMAQNRIRLQNTDLGLIGVRNGMLPSASVVVDLTNNALAGGINEDFATFPGQSTYVSPYFLGGLGTATGQLLRRNFPDYQVRLQLNIPLKNRQARADYTAALLEKRQQEIQMVQAENAVRSGVQSAVIRIQQARARYVAALKAQELQEEALEAEQKRYNLGASTIFLVVQAQRDLANARTNVIATQNEYANARINLNQSTGHTLTAHNISIAEAYEGVVSKRPDPLPASVQ
ncbi:MAG: TolC family protein [Bryobacterales bacterium]|nr:TolC family protein [Bryobacterales bacterium]